MGKWAILVALSATVFSQGTASNGPKGNFQAYNKIFHDIVFAQAMYDEIEPGKAHSVGIFCTHIGLDDLKFSAVRSAREITMFPCRDGPCPEHELLEQIDLNVRVTGIRAECVVLMSFLEWIRLVDPGSEESINGSLEIYLDGASLSISTSILSRDFSASQGKVVRSPKVNFDDILNPGVLKIDPDSDFWENVGNSAARTASVLPLTLRAIGWLSGLGLLTGIIAALIFVDDIIEALVRDKVQVYMEDPHELLKRIEGPMLDLSDALLETVNSLLAENPLSQAETISDLSEQDFEELARDRGRRLLFGQPEALNLFENFVTDLLFSADSDKKTLDVTELIESIPGTDEETLLLNAFLGYPDSDIFALDLLPHIAQLAGDEISDDLTFDVKFDGLANFSFQILGCSLDTTPPSEPNDRGVVLELLSETTVSIPSVQSGDITITVDLGVSFNASLDTDSIPGNERELKHSIKDEMGQVVVTIDSLVSRAAVFLAISNEKFNALQIGPLYENPVDCALSAFSVVPSISAVQFIASNIDVQVFGFDDGLVVFVKEVINGLFQAYQAAVPDYLASFVEGIELIQFGNCPPVRRTRENTNELFDFSREGFIKEISDAVTPETLIDALAGVAKVDDNNVAQLFDERTNLLDLEVPLGNGERIALDILGVQVGNALPPIVKDLKLLRAEPDTPQLLQNVLDISSSEFPISVAARFELQEFDAAGQFVQRNDVTLELSLERFFLVFDILLTYSEFDFLTLPIGELPRLNCLVSRLRPGGGVKEAKILFEGLKAKIICHDCQSSPMLQEWSSRLENPKASEDLEEALNSMLKKFTDAVLDAFSEENFADTIKVSRETCEQDISIIVMPEQEEESSFYTVASIGTFASLIGFVVVSTCRFRLGHQPHSDSGKETLTLKENEFHQDQALYKHDMIPVYIKLLVPMLLWLNFVMFILGHTGDVIDAGLLLNILGLPLNIESFGAFSVVSTTFALFLIGSTGLALLLFFMSILWPYLKVLGMTICWFTPGRWLSFKKRDNLITILDQLGKWSLVELYFVAFVLVLLNIVIKSPNTTFMPVEHNAYYLELLLNAELSLFTFISALILSLIISNVIFVYQKRIKHIVCNDFASKSSIPANIRLSILEFTYFTYNKKGKLLRTLRITSKGQWAVKILMIVSIILTLIAAGIPVLNIEIVGLARPFIEAGGGQSNYGLSVYSFVAMTFAKIDTARAYFAVVFLITVLILPVIQMVVLVVLASSKFTLERAIIWQERNAILSSWCATEVFVLAAILTVIELEKATEGLIGNSCDFARPIIEPLLVAQIIDGRDAAALCFALYAKVEIGLALFFFTMILSQLIHLAITRVFKSYIEMRKGQQHAQQDRKLFSNRNIYGFLAKLNLIEVGVNPGSLSVLSTSEKSPRMNRTPIRSSNPQERSPSSESSTLYSNDAQVRETNSYYRAAPVTRPYVINERPRSPVAPPRRPYIKK